MIDFVFCCSQSLTAALHVAARSVLESLGDDCRSRFWVFSEDLVEEELELLRKTLEASGREFELEFRSISSADFHGYPSMEGSLAPYFRLLVPDLIDVDRYVYLDVDILCSRDMSDLFQQDLGEAIIGLCPEAPLESCVDESARNVIGANVAGSYYNAGVMLVRADRWRESKMTEKCLETLKQVRPQFLDQTLLNIVLRGKISPLVMDCNRFANVRTNWPLLRPPKAITGILVHFTDWPKPWSFLGRWIHPLGEFWWSSYCKTAHFRKHRGKHCNNAWRDLLRSKSAYRRSLKDKILFAAYCRGLLRQPKGVPSDD